MCFRWNNPRPAIGSILCASHFIVVFGVAASSLGILLNFLLHFVRMGRFEEAVGVGVLKESTQTHQSQASIEHMEHGIW